MRAGASVLLLRTLGEFSHVTIRKMAMPIGNVRPFIEAWRAVFPIQPARQRQQWNRRRGTAPMIGGLVVRANRVALRTLPGPPCPWHGRSRSGHAPFADWPH